MIVNVKNKVKKFLVIPLLALTTAVTISGCMMDTAKDPVKSNAMQVVATTTMLTDLVKEIGKDKITVTGLMKAGVDPHLYQATAGDVNTMTKADVVVYNGVHLEGKMGSIFDNLGKQNKTLIRVSDGINKRDLLDFNEDGQTVKDPHIWFSIPHWKAAAMEVAKGLSKKDMPNKDFYEKNAKDYIAKLDDLDKENRQKINQIPEESRVLITAHDAFSYFAKDYGFTVKGIQGVSTESEAASADISALANYIVEHKIKAIFVESSVPTKTIEALQAAVKAKGFDVKVGGELYSDSLGNSDSAEGTFIGMYKHNIEVITSALK